MSQGLFCFVQIELLKACRKVTRGLGLPPTYKPQCPKYGFIFRGRESIMPGYCHLRVPLVAPEVMKYLTEQDLRPKGAFMNATWQRQYLHVRVRTSYSIIQKPVLQKTLEYAFRLKDCTQEGSCFDIVQA